jgi:hypothetical protein
MAYNESPHNRVYVRRDMVTVEQVLAAVEADEQTGFCTECGDETGPVEPDARGYCCESCGEFAVYGAEELLFHFVA